MRRFDRRSVCRSNRRKHGPRISSDRSRKATSANCPSLPPSSAAFHQENHRPRSAHEATASERRASDRSRTNSVQRRRQWSSRHMRANCSGCAPPQAKPDGLETARIRQPLVEKLGRLLRNHCCKALRTLLRRSKTSAGVVSAQTAADIRFRRSHAQMSRQSASKVDQRRIEHGHSLERCEHRHPVRLREDVARQMECTDQNAGARERIEAVGQRSRSAMTSSTTAGCTVAVGSSSVARARDGNVEIFEVAVHPRQ